MNATVRFSSELAQPGKFEFSPLARVHGSLFYFLSTFFRTMPLRRETARDIRDDAGSFNASCSVPEAGVDATVSAAQVVVGTVWVETMILVHCALFFNSFSHGDDGRHRCRILRRYRNGFHCEEKRRKNTLQYGDR